MGKRETAVAGKVDRGKNWGKLGLVFELMTHHRRAQGRPGQTTWWRPDCVHLRVLNGAQPGALSCDSGNMDAMGWAGPGMGAGLQGKRFLLPTNWNFPSLTALHGSFIHGFLLLPPSPWWSCAACQALGQKEMSIIFIFLWGGGGTTAALSACPALPR